MGTTRFCGFRDPPVPPGDPLILSARAPLGRRTGAAHQLPLGEAAMHRRIVPALLLSLVSVPGSLAAQYFGRNKVQYTNFDFKVIQTEHFDVYYYDRERVAALDAA